MIILIPAYKPDEKFPALLDRIKEVCGYKVVAVDDGGGPDYDGIFAEAEKKGAELIRYPVNKGKGGALKTGLKYIAEKYPDEPVVTADCDGQHRAEDIRAAAEKLGGRDNTLVLGCREIRKMPLRSRTGNTLTRFFFWLFFGKLVSDTQTGVRAFSPSLRLPFSEIRGDRFEYEMNMLIKAVDSGVFIDEAPIATIYDTEKKQATHFNSLKDGFRIYALMIKDRLSFVFGWLAALLSLIFIPMLYGASLSVWTAALSAVAATAARFLVLWLFDFFKEKKPPVYKPTDVIFGVLACLALAGAFVFFIFTAGRSFVGAAFAALAVTSLFRLLFRHIKMKIREKKSLKGEKK